MKRPALVVPFLLLALALGACSKKPEQSVNAASKTPEAIAVKVAIAEARTVERSIMVTGSLIRTRPPP